jgi:hypothetical protein
MSSSSQTIPWGSRARRATAGRAGFGEHQIPFRLDNGSLVMNIAEAISDHWLYIVSNLNHAIDQ